VKATLPLLLVCGELVIKVVDVPLTLAKLTE
jgi:hypothetical protein